MKLPNFRLNALMNALRAQMGIAPDQFGSFAVQVAPGRLTVDELRKLTTGDGIDIDFTELTILPDGTLAYKDSRVLLYIRDHHVYNDRPPEPRYHFYNCRTLVHMRDVKRIDKYVVATEATGSFRIIIVERNQSRSEYHNLKVCQNCLSEVSFDGFSLDQPIAQRQTYVAQFVPQKFFEKYPRSLVSSVGIGSAATAPLNDYPENWGKISRAARAAANWTCPQCKLILQVHRRKYLQVHHVNGVRSDNEPHNLQVLCLGCHAEEPQHHHLKNHPDYRRFLSETGWRPPQ